MKAFGPPGEEMYLNMKAFEENESWYLENSPLLAKDLKIESEIVNTQAFSGVRWGEAAIDSSSDAAPVLAREAQSAEIYVHLIDFDSFFFFSSLVARSKIQAEVHVRVGILRGM